MSALRCILTFLITIALPSINGVVCCPDPTPNFICHCYLTDHRLGLYVPISYSDVWEDDLFGYLDALQETFGYPDIDPFGYSDDFEGDPLGLLNTGQDKEYDYLNRLEDDQFEYPDIGEEFNYTYRFITKVGFPFKLDYYAKPLTKSSANFQMNIMNEGISMCAFMHKRIYIMIPSLYSQGYYLATDDLYKENIEEICTKLHYQGTPTLSDNSYGCRDIKLCHNFQDEVSNDTSLDTKNQKMKKSLTSTQYGDKIQALPGLSTTSNPHNTPRMKPSCCHGNKTSQDDAARSISQDCYECRSDPWDSCGEGFDPSSEGVMEVQCELGCQKSVHSDYVSRGCLSSNHHDECTNNICMTSLCTHCCIGELCNRAQHSIHNFKTGIALNFQVIILLLLNTYLLQFD